MLSVSTAHSLSYRWNNPHTEPANNAPRQLWTASLLPGKSTYRVEELVPASLRKRKGYSLHLREKTIPGREHYPTPKKRVLPWELEPEFDGKAAKYCRDVLCKPWPPRVVISFSGGKDSTALVLRSLEDGLPVDSIVWCDTGWEFPEMYDHVVKLAKYAGVQIHVVKPKHDLAELLKKYRWPTMGRRWCTSEKKMAIRRFLKTRSEKFHYLEAIGFAVGEEERTRKKGMWKNKRSPYFPLIDRWAMSEPDCLDFCKSHGFEWGGLYEIMDRVSCFCCPLSKQREHLAIKRQFPDLWKKMLEMDRAIPVEKYIPYYKGKMRLNEYGEWLEYRNCLLG